MSESRKRVPLGRADQSLADGLFVRGPGGPDLPNRTLHEHDFHQLTLLLAPPGDLEWRMGDERSEALRPESGDVVICPAHTPVRVHSDRPLEAVTLRLTTSLVNRIAGRAGRQSHRLRPTLARRDPFLDAVARQLAGSSGVDQRLYAESLGSALAVHLLREYSEAAPTTRVTPRLADDDVRRVTSYIDAHLTDDLSLDSLATLCGLSPHYFLRRFRAATGATPHQFVLERRVAHAHRLLQQGASAASAALAAGFSSQSHLHQQMRRRLGVTPGEAASQASDLKRPLP